jgi:hypothetical protein
VATVNVSDDVVPVIGLGLKLAVTPVGSEDALSVTEPVKPFSRAMLIVEVPEAPREMVTVDGEAERMKAGGGVVVTVSAYVAV